MILQRLSTLGCEDEKKDAFKHELATYPPSLFTENGLMRPTNKSKFAKFLLSDTSTIATGENSGSELVLDGGMLLHSLPWKKGETFGSILASYVNHVCNIQRDYASCLVVFDGYLNVSTKDHAHMSRYPIALHLLKFK